MHGCLSHELFYVFLVVSRKSLREHCRLAFVMKTRMYIFIVMRCYTEHLVERHIGLPLRVILRRTWKERSNTYTRPRGPSISQIAKLRRHPLGHPRCFIFLEF